MTMSIYELAQLRSSDGDAMVVALPAALAVLRAAPGCGGASVRRCIEEPDRFVVTVEWDSVEAHIAFRESEAFAGYREPIGGLFAEPPVFAHYEDVEI
jgi:quinol monooxygenase YgiN